MKNLLVIGFFALLLIACKNENPSSKKYALANEILAKNNIQRYTLTNGWSLTPIGQNLQLGDLPLNMVVSADKTKAIVTNNGQSEHVLQLIDIQNKTIIHQTPIAKAWLGLALDDERQKVYVSTGNDNSIKVYSIADDKFTLLDSIALGKPWPEDSISVAGISLDKTNNLLYAVTKGDKALYVINLNNNSVSPKTDLGSEAYSCLLSQDNNTLYISLWGGAAIAIYDAVAKKISSKIPVGHHPNDMVLSKDGKRLFVACSDENAVAVVDLTENKETERIIASLFPDAPTGSTPNALGLSEDGEMLFIANADNNCLAVFDVEQAGNSRSLGFIPTGWYPTSVKIVGDQILVINGKGVTSAPNPKGPNPYEDRTEETQYIGSLFKGSMQFLSIPDEETLAGYSELVYQNTPYSKEKEETAEGETGNPIPTKVGAPSPIKYVFYIIKENRTYDQVFGDIAAGNGDPSLCLFPDSVTPNLHALANTFVLLDNFYVDAEVSADGHNWSMAAYANDYVEKTWPTLYGGRGGTYDYEGGKEIAYPKDGFIWDYCKRAGVSYRTYGEFANLNKIYLKSLEGHTCTQYPGYDTSIKDIIRFEKWKQDFDSLLTVNAVPRFNTIRFGNDHTAGARPGMPTPAAMVADNDLAVGKFVEYVSKSAIWKESVIFILEDDAQNGPDHVDAHRSIALVIGPFVKRNHKESTMYSTSGMLRTIELILGIEPMSQYDAAATPMFACFTSNSDVTTYTAIPNNIDLDELNPDNNGRLSLLSQRLNLDKEDQAPDLLLSEIIWKTVRGEDSIMPAPRRSAFVLQSESDDED